MAPGAPPTAAVFNRREALDRFRRTRQRTRALFDLLDPAAYVHKPIALRNPIVFYEGHLPAFTVNTLIKKGLGRPGIDERLETIFARGIDPDEEAAAVARGNPAWPGRDAVRAYADAADALVEDAMANADVTRDDHPLLRHAQAVWAVIEHEEMHQETLAYMWHQVRYEWKNKPAHYVTAPPRLRGGPRPSRALVPRGVVTIGTPDEGQFAWDNERPSRRVEVAAFEIDTLKVTNADFMQFVEAGGYREPRYWRPQDWEWVQGEQVSHPPFWELRDGSWQWLAMFERVALPGEWPVYVTWAEANAYSRWRGERLMTEAEFIRASAGSAPVNVDFARFDPVPVGSAVGASEFGVYDLVGNGWEWTADVFAPFDGFSPLPSYPEYSADFFDGDHFVMKGASPVTARGLIRPGFRNWFRPRYPYIYAAFRCVKTT
jgi:iron(II)-dependent oxidoreductase